MINCWSFVTCWEPNMLEQSIPCIASDIGLPAGTLRSPKRIVYSGGRFAFLQMFSRMFDTFHLKQFGLCCTQLRCSYQSCLLCMFWSENSVLQCDRTPGSKPVRHSKAVQVKMHAFLSNISWSFQQTSRIFVKMSQPVTLERLFFNRKESPIEMLLK